MRPHRHDGYHGYRFRILEEQGANGAGGAKAVKGIKRFDPDQDWQATKP